MQTAFHHVAISVRNLDKSHRFYEQLGFTEVHRWDADDSSLTIVHLKLNDMILELFAYANSANQPPLNLDVANNLSQIGIKHIGLRVQDIHSCFISMKENGYEVSGPEIKHGKTKIDYFFIKDPDGMWVEIAQDDRGY